MNNALKLLSISKYYKKNKKIKILTLLVYIPNFMRINLVIFKNKPLNQELKYS